MSSCAEREAKGWAIGMIAAAVAVSILALGIAVAVKIGHRDSGRICLHGHDGIPKGYSSMTFICDEWVPKPQATVTP